MSWADLWTPKFAAAQQSGWLEVNAASRTPCQYPPPDPGLLHLECERSISQLSGFPLIKLCCTRRSACPLNFKSAPDTEALCCSSRWQNDEQLAPRKNTRPIRRHITHWGRCAHPAQCTMNEQVSLKKNKKKQSEHWTLGFKTWPCRLVKINSQSSRNVRDGTISV